MYCKGSAALASIFRCFYDLPYTKIRLTLGHWLRQYGSWDVFSQFLFGEITPFSGEGG